MFIDSQVLCTHLHRTMTLSLTFLIWNMDDKDINIKFVLIFYSNVPFVVYQSHFPQVNTKHVSVTHSMDLI